MVLRLPPQLDGYSRTIFTDDGFTGAAIAVDLFQDIVAGKVKARAQITADVATGRPGASAYINSLT
jgi:hypothetical protein